MKLEFKDILTAFNIVDVNDLILHYETIRNAKVIFVDKASFLVDRENNVITNPNVQLNPELGIRTVNMGLYKLNDSSLLSIIMNMPNGTSLYVYVEDAGIIANNFIRLAMIDNQGVITNRGII